MIRNGLAILTLAGLFFVYQVWDHGGSAPQLTLLNSVIADYSEPAGNAGITNIKSVERRGSAENIPSSKPEHAFSTRFIDPMAERPEDSLPNRKPGSVGDYIDPLANNISNEREPAAVGSFVDPLEFTEKATSGHLEVGTFIDPDGVEVMDSQYVKRMSIGAYIDPDNS